MTLIETPNYESVPNDLGIGLRDINNERLLIMR